MVVRVEQFWCSMLVASYDMLHGRQGSFIFLQCSLCKHTPGVPRGRLFHTIMSSCVSTTVASLSNTEGWKLRWYLISFSSLMKYLLQNIHFSFLRDGLAFSFSLSTTHFLCLWSAIQSVGSFMHFYEMLGAGQKRLG